MKLLLISIDPILSDLVEKSAAKHDFELLRFNESTDPIDILSTVCSLHPNVLIFDDDFLESKAGLILNSVKKVNKKIAVIFVTSNDSIELGREISNIGIQFYGLKPLSGEELNDLFQSIPNLVNKHIN